MYSLLIKAHDTKTQQPTTKRICTSRYELEKKMFLSASCLVNEKKNFYRFLLLFFVILCFFNCYIATF